MKESRNKLHIQKYYNRNVGGAMEICIGYFNLLQRLRQSKSESKSTNFKAA